jgi:hypothetical protein
MAFCDACGEPIDPILDLVLISKSDGTVKHLRCARHVIR